MIDFPATDWAIQGVFQEQSGVLQSKPSEHIQRAVCIAFRHLFRKGDPTGAILKHRSLPLAH